MLPSANLIYIACQTQRAAIMIVYMWTNITSLWWRGWVVSVFVSGLYKIIFHCVNVTHIMQTLLSWLMFVMPSTLLNGNADQSIFPKMPVKKKTYTLCRNQLFCYIFYECLFPGLIFPTKSQNDSRQANRLYSNTFWRPSQSLSIIHIYQINLCFNLT